MADRAKPQLRQIWRRNWLASIRELSALDWQRDLWGKSDNPHHSFDEYLTVYFDEVVFSDGYEARIREGLLSASEVDAIDAFHSLIDAYPAPSNPVDHNAVLADPAWAEVVNAATRARENLLALIADPEERRELLRDQPEYP